MTNEQVKVYLTEVAKRYKVGVDNLNNYLDVCILLAIEDAWNAYEWETRTRSEFPLTVNGVITELPADFAKLRSIKQKDFSQGLRLFYYPKAEFDRRFPDPSAITGSYTQAFTIFRDGAKWKLGLVPPPGSTKVYLDYYTTAPTSMDQAPGHLTPVILAAAEKYLSGKIDYASEVARAQVNDSTIGDMGGRMFDETDEPRQVVWAWVDYS